MEQPKERVLFLYLHTGGGHISLARSLAAECSERNSSREVEVHLLDGIPERANLSRALIEDGYRFATLSIPLIWPVLYQTTRIALFMYYHAYSMILISCARIRNYIRKHKITRIVNLHFLMNAPLFRALRQLRMLDMPIVTVVTDPYTCHPIWFFHQFTSLVVFSRQIHKNATRYLRWIGVSNFLLPRKREIVIHPPVLHAKFNTTLRAEACKQLRKQYNFSLHKRLILIAGGGEGLPAGEHCLRAIARAGLDVQVAFVCGRNISQYERIQNIARQFPNTSIQVYGFVNFMYELMNMADIILTKAGPATIFESLMLKKPLIITRRIYGQEQGNVDFVVNHKLGWYITRPRKIARKIQTIIENPMLIEQIVNNITETGISNGASKIADYIMNLPQKPEKRKKLMDMLAQL